jgi:hypothetical protein
MERTKLLSELVDIDARIIATTAIAARTHTDRDFERLILEVRRLRQQRAEIQAKLDADKQP